MLKSVANARPTPTKHLWLLVQRLIAVEGPMLSKDVYARAKDIYGDKVGTFTYFKRQVLNVMKKHEQADTKTNMREIRAAERELKQVNAETLKKAKETHEQLQVKLQEKYGASFTKTAFRPNKKGTSTKSALPSLEFRWHLKARQDKIAEWKAAGLPTPAELDALAIRYKSWIPPAERPEAILPPWQR
ncbi:hypothetical protein BDF22DRAFT_656284 [Syncephalis plumigaleata]|nr:hypothetical protein BDF22DRAFT_656284 [Syncephalis plumigaleata]